MLRRCAAGQGLIGEGLGIDVAFAVGLVVFAAVPKVLDGFAGGQQAVLALVLLPVRVPPEHGALAGAAVDAVDVIHLPGF